MGTPKQHALLSASSAHRWLECTASPRFEEQFSSETRTSTYAQEGTLAHTVCELHALREFQPENMSKRKFNSRINKCKQDKLFDEEMLRCAESYVQFLKEKTMEYESMPYVATEVRVDLTDYIPQGFGTCDCIMVGGDHLQITDYKHGKGVAVSALENPQMRLYALGALKYFSLIFGNGIKTVIMSIFQPRLSSTPSEETITVDELKAWGESIKPLAQAAFTGKGTKFSPGEHCRFCKGKAQCRARADQNTALEDFKDFAIAGKAAPGLLTMSEEAKKAVGLPPMLSDAEIGDLLVRGKSLVQWYKDLQEYATQALLDGKKINGWKIVEGKSNRVITDTDALVERFKEKGFDEALLFERKPLTLTAYEKLAGKADFAEIANGLINKPQGKPTLAPVSDKRPVFNSAVSDFSEVSENG